MAVADFPSNSNTSKYKSKYPDEGTPKTTSAESIKKPIVGKVTRRKPTIGRRFSQVFSFNSIEETITRTFFDVVVPMAKDMIYESLERTLRGAILGDDGPRSSSPSRSSHHNYQSHYPSSSRTGRRDEIRHSRPRGGYSYDEIIFETKDFADEVLEWMYDVVEAEGFISVRQLLEEANEPFTHTDNKWGWMSLSGSDVVRIPGEGWIIKLPKPRAL